MKLQNSTKNKWSPEPMERKEHIKNQFHAKKKQKTISPIQNIQKPEAKVACLNLFFPKISKIHSKITYQSPIGPGCFWFLLDSPWFSGFTGSFFSALLGGSQVTETVNGHTAHGPLVSRRNLKKSSNSWSVARDDMFKK